MLKILTSLVFVTMASASLPGPAAGGQEQPSPTVAALFNLESAVERGIEANPGLEAYRYGLKAAESRKNSARSGLLPKLSASAGYRQLKNESEKEFNQDYLDQDVDLYSLRISQPLFTGFRAWNSWKKAGLEAELMGSRLRMQRLDLAHRIQTYFLELLRVREDLRASYAAVDRLETQLEAAEAWVKVDMRPKLEVLQARAELESARSRVLTVANAEQILMTRLHVLLDLPKGRRVEYQDDLLADPPGELPVPDYFLEKARENRPDLEIARRNVEIAEKDVSLAKGGYMPKVTLDADYSCRNMDYRKSYPPDVERKYWTVGINAEWELFSGGRDYYETQRSSRIVSSEKERMRELEESIVSEVREALLNHADATARIDVAREALNAAREAFDAARSRYKAGVGTITDILNTQNQVTRSETDLNRAKAARLQAMADLYRASGILNPGLRPSAL